MNLRETAFITSNMRTIADPLQLVKGDIGAVRATGLVGWLATHCFKPRTDRMHYFLIGQYLPQERDGAGDYVIYESIASKGIAVGLLYYHYVDRGFDVKFYRIADPVARLKGEKVITEIFRQGRAKYDYFLAVKLFLGVLRLTLTGHLPPWDARMLKYGVNSAFLCTEAVNLWKAVGHPIVPKGVPPLPSGVPPGRDEWCYC